MVIFKHVRLTAACLAFTVWGALGLMAQSNGNAAPQMRRDADPEFEVATIKPNQSPGVSLKLSEAGIFESTGTTLSFLIRFAYDLQARQIIGGPSWMETERYDVSGKPDHPGKPTLIQLKAMIRKLLADRFQLAVRP